ncbi:peptide/nickel transport system ATP-binding protein [Azospirillum fermentarium]|uniref:ABC transporter ATP-binding protein n=1 Tax=Azospirillum fermentarium TaxID=1233114 RepID=UPI002227059A|nr:ABC transporter ATP-binding protein [Azospirillum fermentarium]MCW2248753.1 peptide/nickel transport system ATP-binding protein [Azospirillum fermentarium]
MIPVTIPGPERALSTQAVLELRGVSHTFQVRRSPFRRSVPLRAVDDVSLCVHRGEVLGLVGESGCGKSTLSRILLGLLPPSAGEVLLDGAAVAGTGQAAFARRVQPVFQDPYSSLNPRKTVAQIIGLPLAVHGIGDRAGRRQAVAAMLDRVGLPRRVLDTYPKQLSGGQRQRVAIARALIMRPEVVVCDEPTSALDVSVQAQILNLLIELRREFDLGMLMISHNLAVIEHMATWIAVMYLGRIVESGPTRAIFEQPRHPYTRALLQSVLTTVPGHGIPDPLPGTAIPNPVDRPSGCAFHPRCPLATDQCRTVPPPRAAGAGRGGFVECHLSPAGGAEAT